MRPLNQMAGTSVRSRMPRYLYTVCEKEHAANDSTKSFENGGRWNSPGRHAIYTSDTYAGALLEALAHEDTNCVPGAHHCCVITVPDDVETEAVSPSDLPGWNDPDMAVSRAYGDEWIGAQRSVILLVPAVPSQPFGLNAIINPAHPDYGSLLFDDPVQVEWDERLFATRSPG